MVVDYSYIKQILKKYVEDKFDHRCVNFQEADLFWRSSTELMARYFWKVLIEFFPSMSNLRLYETPDSYCDYKGPKLV
jgi:6-pyruvoyl-tetrahydropterin synthase